MLIDVYKTTLSTVFILVLAGATPPPCTGATTHWKTVDLTKPLIALDCKQAMADVDKQGWAKVGISVEVKIFS